MQNLKKTLQQAPSFAPAIINLGTLYFLNEEYKKATEEYNSDILTSSENYSEFEGILILHQAANAAKNYLSLESREKEVVEEDTEDIEVDTEEESTEEGIRKM